MGVMLEDVADYLASKGLGVKGTNMWGGRMPGNPSFAIALYQQTGFEPIRAMGTRRIQELALQVLVRDAVSSVAHDHAFAIYAALDVEFNLMTLVQRQLNGVQYYSILARHAPFGIGQDENQRFRWSCNYIVRRD